MNNHSIQSPNKLLQKGIQYLQELSGETWTDYNIHDPGLTILEQLSYALADLNYRTSFDMKDLLTLPPESIEKAHEVFTAREILPAHPCTISDYRKLILDLPGIRNVWIMTASQTEPIFKNTGDTELSHASDKDIAEAKDTIQLKGLYKVLLDFDKAIEINADSKAELADKVMALLMAHRNLGEDFLPIETVKKEAVTVETEIELDNNTSVAETLAEIYYQIDHFLMPRVKFHSLDELLERGLPIHTIFDGPALNHGFLIKEELPKHRTAIYTSDLIQIIMDIKGVKAVRNFHAASHPDGTDFRSGQRWCLRLNPELNYSPKLDPEKCAVNFVKNGILEKADQKEADFEKALELYEAKKEKDRQNQYPTSPEMDLAMPTGRYRNLHAYYSIQNDFPQNYGIGPEGLSSIATSERQAQAKQLKAYLLLFEQLMANYQAQIGNAGTLLSNHYASEQTYFSLKADAVNTDDLYLDPDKIITENNNETAKRTVRFLDHKLGRFAEKVGDYPLLSSTIFNTESLADEIKNKKAFLKGFPLVSQQRGQGFNYTQKHFDSNNVSGLKKRISTLLGFAEKSIKLGDLIGNAAKGFHIVEHLLLRPKSNKDQYLKIFPRAEHHFTPWKTDPYSQIITVIIPFWPTDFEDNGFIEYFEKTVYLETPAHLQVHVLWVTHDEMRTFELAFESWLVEQTKPDFLDTRYANVLNPLIQELNNLYKIDRKNHVPDSILEADTITIKPFNNDANNTVEKVSLNFKMGNHFNSESGLFFDWQDPNNYWLFHYSQSFQKMMVSQVVDGLLQTILSTPVDDLTEKIMDLSLEVKDGKWLCKQKSPGTIGTEFMINGGKTLDHLKVGVYKLKGDGTKFLRFKVIDHIKAISISEPLTFNQENYDNAIA